MAYGEHAGIHFQVQAGDQRGILDFSQADWVENTLCTEGLSPPKDFLLEVPLQYEANVSQRASAHHPR